LGIALNAVDVEDHHVHGSRVPNRDLRSNPI
jgi:hypothetical protein